MDRESLSGRVRSYRDATVSKDKFILFSSHEPVFSNVRYHAPLLVQLEPVLHVLLLVLLVHLDLEPLHVGEHVVLAKLDGILALAVQALLRSKHDKQGRHGENHAATDEH